MSKKIIRDPLYNYIAIDSDRDAWLVKLLDSKEIQRLRRIHQLGVGHLTYPGADHNRLAHSLGVMHLMMQAIQRLQDIYDDAQIRRGRDPLLAAALLHDIGHGPFSHLFEPCLNIDHEIWSKRIILSEESDVYRILLEFDRTLPRTVADLIDKDNNDHPSWQKSLLSSQLDMDRLDYLRRDSLFTGSGYGHFDWFRLINSFELFIGIDQKRDVVWTEKSSLAVEEYIYSRFYMYQNVYFHKTTRGFEKMLEAMWIRARSLYEDGTDVFLVPVLKDFWKSADPEVPLFLKIEEFTILSQIQNWTSHADKSLSDLARRFLERKPFAMIESPDFVGEITPSHEAWKLDLLKLVGDRTEYAPTEMYCLEDRVKAKYNQPYFPEKEDDEQSVKNAIRIRVEGEARPVEISRLLPRLKSLSQEPLDRIRYYIPKDLRNAANDLRKQWKK